MSKHLKRSSWNFYSGSQLTFGPRAIGSLASVITRRGAKRVLLVADPVLERVGLVGLVQQVIEQTPAKLQIFTEGHAEPSTRTVQSAAEMAREFSPDLFVGLGGGSNMDLAKVCCAVFAHGCSAESVLGFDTLPGPTPTLVCIPTTAGTGSEVSHSAVLKDTAGKRWTVLSQHLRPDVAIVDPYLTLSCPARLTAENGLHALARAIEAYLVANFYSLAEDIAAGLPYEGNNPLGDLYAERAIGLINQHLPRVIDDPENLAARSGMSLAATLSGVAFSNCGVGLSHALELGIADIASCSQGVASGIVLPAVMRYLQQYRAGRLAKIGQLLGIDHELTQQAGAERAVQQVEKLRAKLGLPMRLREVGVSEDQLSGLAKSTISSKQVVDLTPGHPAQADVLAILRACL